MKPIHLLLFFFTLSLLFSCKPQEVSKKEAYLQAEKIIEGLDSTSFSIIDDRSLILRGSNAEIWHFHNKDSVSYTFFYFLKDDTAELHILENYLLANGNSFTLSEESISSVKHVSFADEVVVKKSLDKSMYISDGRYENYKVDSSDINLDSLFLEFQILSDLRKELNIISVQKMDYVTRFYTNRNYVLYFTPDSSKIKGLDNEYLAKVIQNGTFINDQWCLRKLEHPIDFH